MKLRFAIKAVTAHYLTKKALIAIEIDRYVTHLSCSGAFNISVVVIDSYA